MLNWQRKTTWTDVQNAKCIKLIDGRGNVYDKDLTPQRYICCDEGQFNKRLKLMSSLHYKYPLQRWIGDSYVLFEKSIVEIPKKKTFMTQICKLLHKGKESKEGLLEVKVVTVYLRSHFIAAGLDKPLTNAIEGSGIWPLMYDTAKAFVETNRPNELELFKEMYSTKLPRDCFINLYDVNLESGIDIHCDHVSFCTIVLCLEGNKDDSLVLIQETNEPLSVTLSTNDMIVFARIKHYVKVVTRSDRRITLNAFF
jgi:hypothetical protein